MSPSARIGDSLRGALDPLLADVKSLVIQGDFVATRNLLQRVLQLVQRSAGSRIHLELLKLFGLICEMLGYRVEAGISYCVGMRLARSANPSLEQIFSRRLAHLAHPEKQRPLLPANADDEQLQALSRFLHARFDCLWEIEPARVLQLVQALGPLKTDSDVGQWIAEDLGYLAAALSETAFRDVLLAAPTAQWRSALIHARPGTIAE